MAKHPKKTFEEILETSKRVSLTAREKKDIHGRVRVYMEAHPVSDGLPVRHNGKGTAVRSGTGRLLWSTTIVNRNVLQYVIRSMTVLAFIALLVGGGLSVSAEQALPGDFLYPVKVNINEEIRSWAAISDEAQAQWEVALVERRINEAEALAVRSELDAETRADLEVQFAKHADRVAAHVEKFEQEDDLSAAIEVSSNLETTLRAHEQILNHLAEVRTDAKSSVTDLTKSVRAKASTSATSRRNSETRITGSSSASVQAAASAKLSSAESAVENADKHIKKFETFLGAEAVAQANARLIAASSVIAEGKAKLDAGAYGEAFVLFQKAKRIAQEAKLLINARQDLDIDVRLDAMMNANGDDEKDVEESGDNEQKDERDEPAENDADDDGLNIDLNGGGKLELGL